MKNSFNALDEQISRIQLSTKTTLPLSARPHNWLRMHSPWYYKWHLLPFINALHILILSLYVTGITAGVLTIKTPTTYAAAITWDGGGSTNNWSEAANWSGDVVPGSGDTVTFNSTSTKDATVDGSFGSVITSLTIASGYSGTITLGRNLQTTGSYSQATGTFTSGIYTFDVDSTFVMTGGTFNASSGTNSIANSFTISGSSVFNANGGVISFDGTGGTLTCNNITFNSVTFVNNLSSGKQVNSSCSLPLGASPTIPTSMILNGGTLTGTGTLTFSAGTFTLNSNASLSGFTGLVTSSLTVTTTLDLSAYTTVDINGSFTMNNSSSAVFTAPTGTMTVAVNFTIGTTTTFNDNGGTVDLDGGSSGAVTCNGAVNNFNLVRIVHTAGTKTVGASCNLPVGSNPTFTGATTLQGTVTGTGTLTTNSSLIFTSSGAISGFNTLAVGATLQVSGPTLDLSGMTVSTAGLVLGSGTIIAPTNTMTVAGTVTFSGTGVFNPNGGTINFTGVGSIACNNQPFNLVTFNNTGTRVVGAECTLPVGTNSSVGGTGTITLNGKLTGSGRITFNANATITAADTNLADFDEIRVVGTGAFGDSDLSVFDLVDATGFSASNTVTAPPMLRVGGAFLVNPTATFAHNNGTIVFYSLNSGSSAISCNNQTFHLVRFETTSGRTINADCTFPLGDNPTFSTGQTTMRGTFTGTGTLTTSGRLTFDASTGTMTGFTGFQTTDRLVLTAGTLDFSGYSFAHIHDLSQSGGTFIAPNGELKIDYRLFNSGGTFESGTGTVTFLDSGLDQTLAGSFTFFNLKKVADTTRALYVGAGSTQTVLGNLTLKGTPNNLLYIRSATSGQQWNIDARDTHDVSYLRLLDINNVNPNVINAAPSTKLGNVTGNFNLYNPTVGGVGPGLVTNGSTLATVTPEFTFGLGDNDVADMIKYQIQIDDNADFSSPTVEYISELMANGTSTTFTVGQAAGSGAYAIGAAGQGLGNGSYYWRIRAIDQLGNTPSYTQINGGNVAFVIDVPPPAETTTTTPEASPSPSLSASASPTATPDVIAANPTPEAVTSSSESIAPVPSASSSSTSTSSVKVMLQVRVVDDKQQPVKGALVTISSEQAQAVTDEYGIAIFPSVSPGQHRLVVAYNDQSGAKIINLNATTSSEPQSVAVTVQLKPTPLYMTTPFLIGHFVLILLFLVLGYSIMHRRYGVTLAGLFGPERPPTATP